MPATILRRHQRPALVCALVPFFLFALDQERLELIAAPLQLPVKDMGVAAKVIGAASG